MKRSIAILLALLLVLTGFGNINYAQSDTTNEVDVNFATELGYQVHGDNFTNGMIDGRLQCFDAALNNSPDVTGAGITGLELSLATYDILHFDEKIPEPAQVDPQTYQWSFGDIPQENGVHARVALYSNVFPVSFEPGFDATREADRTVFSEAGWQNLTITVIPREPMASFGVHIDASGDDLVNPTIHSCTGGDWHYISPDGHDMGFEQNDPVVGNTYIFTVTIWVEPSVPVVDFMPAVGPWTSEVTASGDSSNNPFSQTVDPLGTWTWSAQGSYHWNWVKVDRKIVNMLRHSYEVTDDVLLRFSTHYNYVHDEDTFWNHEVPGNRSWQTSLYNRLSDPENIIATANVSLETGMEFTAYSEEGLVAGPPPPYEWSYSEIPPGAEIYTDVGFRPDDPFPALFIPGYNVSRTFDVTTFDGPGVQTLTIELTPQNGMPPWFGIHVIIPQDISFDASIVSCAGANEYYIWDEGHHLQLSEPFGEHPQPYYNYTIEISVNPGAHPVEFWPDVEILTFPADNIPIIDAGVHSSYEKEITGMGTWRYDLSSEYSLSVLEQTAYSVTFEARAVELINESTVLFQEFWTHVPAGDEFTDGDATVPGNITWVTQILNQPDNTGEPISNVTLDLDTSEIFNRVIPPVAGPPYEWSYGDIPVGEIRSASVGTLPDPVEFSPGYNAARSFDRTLFSEPGAQTMTIRVTPRVEYADLLIIDVFAINDENADSVITSFTGADGVFQNQDGHRLMLVKMTTEVDTEYELTVTIDITPKAPQVKYKPNVRIYDPGFTGNGGEFGSSVTRIMPDVGTWTCSADGDYQWSWLESSARSVVFPRDSSVIITDFGVEHMSVDFDHKQPNKDKIVGEGTIQLGEEAAYDLAVDDVVVNVDGVVITIPAGSFIKQGNNECYHYESTSSAEPQINMELDFENGEWRIKVSKVDASVIDNSDGVEITLTVGDLSASELIDMQVGGLTFIADEE